MLQHLLFVLSGMMFALTAQAAPLKVEVQGLQTASGSVMIHFFNSSAAWDSERPTSTAAISSLGSDKAAVNIDLPAGEYAFFLFHDVNADGTLQTNFLGMPAEPYAFSNNFRLQFSKPTWAQLKFRVDETGTIHHVDLVSP